jgi:hypothetical protein
MSIRHLITHSLFFVIYLTFPSHFLYKYYWQHKKAYIIGEPQCRPFYVVFQVPCSTCDNHIHRLPYHDIVFTLFVLIN